MTPNLVKGAGGAYQRAYFSKRCRPSPQFARIFAARSTSRSRCFGRGSVNLESAGPNARYRPLPLWERHRPPSRPLFGKNAEARLRLRRIADAIRVRGYAPPIDLNPSPQPSPTRGE